MSEVWIFYQSVCSRPAERSFVIYELLGVLNTQGQMHLISKKFINTSISSSLSYRDMQDSYNYPDEMWAFL